MSYFYKENQELEEKVQYFFYLLSKVNKYKYNSEISIILLGSLSRGEGSWMMDENNNTILLSDIEFLTIHPDNFDEFKEFDKDIKDAAYAAFENEFSALFHIDNSYCLISKMPYLEKKLLIFDAIEMGKTVVGEDRRFLFPKIDVYTINLFDIRDILSHRIFSVLYYGIPLKTEKRIAEYRYSLAKNSLDLMTVILINNDILISGYQEKLAKIKELPIDDSLKRYFEYCLCIKFSVKSKYYFEIEKMEEIFLRLIIVLDDTFRNHYRNCIHNVKSIFRRKLGVLKRGIKVRNIKFSQKKHLHALIIDYKNEQLRESSIKNNYVLNGYPRENFIKKN